MSKKVSMLALAIEKQSNSPNPTEPSAIAPQLPAASKPPATTTTAYVAPSRAGKTAKTHYLPRSYWETLEEVSFRTRDEQGKRTPQERLVAEALNLLFMKYNFPPVREDDDAT